MPLDIRPDHLKIVEEILEKHVPDREVWAFGSRVNGTAKETSDLDLAVIGENPLEFQTLGALRDAFSESNIPYKVDVVDWAKIEKTFRGIIQKNKVVIKEQDFFSKSWLYYPNFPNHWIRTSLYSLAKWVNGLAFREFQFSPVGKPVIKIAEIKNGISEQTKFSNQSFDNSLLIKKGDLLFSWSGQPETSIDAFWWQGPNGWLNQHIFRVLPIEKIDRVFLFYLLRYLKPNFIGIARNKQTTGLGHVTKHDLEKIEVAYPPLPEQRAIAHILGTLDDKIELNRRMNETLEAMAQAIFKSWFVDFDPVRAKMEGRPTGLPKEIEDLFPDSFEDSELGEIPRGWEVTVLGEIINILDSKRIPLSGKQRNERPGPYPYYGAAGILDFIDDFIFEGIFILVGEDGSVINRNGNPVTQYVWGKFWVSNHAHVLSGNRGISNEHLLLFLQTLEIGPYVTGAVQPKLNQTNLCRIPFLLPNESICKSFEDIVSPIYAIYRENFMQIKILTNIRDNLLPKLLSGEIKVSGIPPRQRSTGERQAK